MQVPGGARLGGHRALEALWVHRAKDAVIDRPGGVDDRSQGVLFGDLGDELLERGLVGYVTGGYPDLCPQLLELCL